MTGVLLFVWCMGVSAQTRVFVDIDQVGGYLLPVALPKLLGEQAEPALGEQIRAVLRADLELSGLFRIVDPATYIDEVPESLDRLRYQNWSTIGAMGVLAGRVQRSAADAQLKLEFALHDVVQERPRFNGREYVGTREQYREMAHRFSDLVFREFTGEDGPFNTQVVCVAPRRAGEKAKDIVLMDYDGYGSQNLVADGTLNLAPSLSPVGAILAYTSYRSGSPQIYLRHLSTGAEERLTSGAGLAIPRPGRLTDAIWPSARRSMATPICISTIRDKSASRGLPPTGALTSLQVCSRRQAACLCLRPQRQSADLPHGH